MTNPKSAIVPFINEIEAALDRYYDTNEIDVDLANQIHDYCTRLLSAYKYLAKPSAPHTIEISRAHAAKLGGIMEKLSEAGMPEVTRKDAAEHAIELDYELLHLRRVRPE